MWETCCPQICFIMKIRLLLRHGEAWGYYVRKWNARLFMNAARAGKKALGILTISDHIFKKEALSAQERQTSFSQMMEIALGI